MTKEEFIKKVKEHLNANDAEAEMIYALKESSSQIYDQMYNALMLVIECKKDENYREDIIKSTFNTYCKTIIDNLGETKMAFDLL